MIDADCSDELLQMIAEHEPDLIVTDCALPNLDLKAVIEHSHARSPTARNRVILRTATQNENQILDLLNLGAVDHVAKPFNAYIVVARCMRLIDMNVAN
ncbi:MAG: response regulator [Marinicaulis sp.]|nr:response regulator [Marinicaulis sp.]